MSNEQTFLSEDIDSLFLISSVKFRSKPKWLDELLYPSITRDQTEIICILAIETTARIPLEAHFTLYILCLLAKCEKKWEMINSFLGICFEWHKKCEGLGLFPCF